MPLLGCNTLEEFLTRYQEDAVLWKANRLLQHLDNPILRNDKCVEIARMLASIPESAAVMRDDYVKKICVAHDLKPKTLNKMISDALNGDKKVFTKKVRKNLVKQLDSDPTKFHFFDELVESKKNEGEIFKGIKVDKVKFIELLSHFGFTRFETNTSDDGKFVFVRITENIIKTVNKNQIIDSFETFIRTEYRFKDAGYQYVNANILLNHFYDRINHFFSMDLFARVRTKDKIIVNRDKKESTYLYYKNGFVEINKEGWVLRKYEEMEGSVWEHQMLDRNFELMVPEIEVDENGIPLSSHPDENGKTINIMKAGSFADFCYKISNDLDRFKSLCSIIGFVMHDFYQYSLKAILLTDSTISEESNGRTGKTLLAKMIGMVRSYCEINGKDFDSGALTKYQDAELGTQVIHLNDVKHRGKCKFEFEDVFNDITEGYIVKKLYMATFRQLSKMIISTNKTLNIQGDSQKDRIVEYEFSSHFHAGNKPDRYYGQWFGRDWDQIEWNKFDNFMCWCAQVFHQCGIIQPADINLGERKLVNYTCPEFLAFMDDIKDNLRTIGLPWPGYTEGSGVGLKVSYEMTDFEFDKKRMFEKFISENKELTKWCTPRFFYAWLSLFSKARFGIEKPSQRKTNGVTLIKFSS